jgi:hypothetical protein
MRLAVTASPLKLHLSPYRYQQLMTVLQSIAPAAPAADAHAAAATATAAGADKPLWLSESEYSGKVCAWLVIIISCKQQALQALNDS